MRLGDLVRRNLNGELCFIIKLWGNNGTHDYVTVITCNNEEMILHYLAITII